MLLEAFSWLWIKGNCSDQKYTYHKKLTDVGNRVPKLASSGWWDVNDSRAWPRAKLTAEQEASVAKQRMHQRGILGHSELRLVPGFDTGRKSIQWVTRGAVAAPKELTVQPQGWPTNALLSIVELPVQTRRFSYLFLRDKKIWNRDRILLAM